MPKAHRPAPRTPVAHRPAPVAPKTLAEATTRLQKLLGRKASVSSDVGEDRVLIRCDAKDLARLQKQLAAAGVKKTNSGVRDLLSFGAFEVTLSPWATATPA